MRKGSPPSVQAISCSTPWRATIASSRDRSVAGVDSVLKRKLKSTTISPGMTLPAPVPAWMFDICHDVGWKCALPASHVTDASSASTGAARWIGFLARCGIGDMALHAEDSQLGRERAAAAVLDHVADAPHRRRLADDAVVERRAALDQPVAHAHRAVARRAFLVARDQERDRAGRVGMRRDEFLGRDDHRRDRALHVGGAAAVEDAVAVGRHERVAVPGRERAGRDDVGVAGEDHPLAGGRRAGAVGPEVRHARRLGAEGKRRADEAERREALGDERLAAAVVGSDGATRDQRFGKMKGRRHRRCRKRSRLRTGAGSARRRRSLPAARRS